MLDHGVAEVVNGVGVVARAAAQGVGTCTAVEDVVACVAGDHVVQRVASGAQVGAAGEHQVLCVGTKAVADAGVDGVGTGCNGLGDHIARVVDHIGVVTRTASHHVGTGAAVQRVVVLATVQGVVACAAQQSSA